MRGIVMRATAIVRTKSIGSSRARIGERRALDLDQHVDRHAFRMCSAGSPARAIMPTRSVTAFAHADDAAAADIDAGVAHRRQRFQPVLIGAGGDDLAVEFRRGVEIVVVVIEPGILQARGLRLRSACRA